MAYVTFNNIEYGQLSAAVRKHYKLKTKKRRIVKKYVKRLISDLCEMLRADGVAYEKLNLMYNKVIIG